jgi:hypothetical protein
VEENSNGRIESGLNSKCFRFDCINERFEDTHSSKKEKEHFKKPHQQHTR